MVNVHVHHWFCSIFSCVYSRRADFNNATAHIWIPSVKHVQCCRFSVRNNKLLLNLCLTRLCIFLTNHDYCHNLSLQPTSFYPLTHQWQPPFICQRVQPHIHNVFTRPEMNRAIIISHVNSADNDQKLSPALPSFSSLPLCLLWGAYSGDKPPLLLFHGLFKDLVRPTNHYF